MTSRTMLTKILVVDTLVLLLISDGHFQYSIVKYVFCSFLKKYLLIRLKKFFSLEAKFAKIFKNHEWMLAL